VDRTHLPGARGHIRTTVECVPDHASALLRRQSTRAIRSALRSAPELLRRSPAAPVDPRWRRRAARSRSPARSREISSIIRFIASPLRVATTAGQEPRE